MHASPTQGGLMRADRPLSPNSLPGGGSRRAVLLALEPTPTHRSLWDISRGPSPTVEQRFVSLESLGPGRRFPLAPGASSPLLRRPSPCVAALLRHISPSLLR